MFTALRQKIQQHADKIQIGRTGAHLLEWFKNNPNASRVEQVDAAYAIIARYSPLDKELWGCKAIEYVTDYRIEHNQWPITTPEKSTVEIAEKAWLEAHKAAKAAWPQMSASAKAFWYDPADNTVTPEAQEARAESRWCAAWCEATDAEKAAWKAAIERQTAPNGG
jgi:hypothetical protein